MNRSNHTNKDSIFSQQLIDKDKGSWSEIQNTKENWITTAINKTDLGIDWQYPPYSCDQQEVSLNKDGNYIIDRADSGSSSIIKFKEGNFYFSFVSEPQKDGNNSIISDVLKKALYL